jgi:lipoyl(octanoyl) transferase
VRELVCRLEESIIRVLRHYRVQAARRPGAPGVYVAGAKIAALGLRVRRGRSFHGLAFNVDMDLEPFQRINPCGFQGLQVTQLVTFAEVKMDEVKTLLVRHLAEQLGYASVAESREDAA